MDADVIDAVLDWRAANRMPADRWVGPKVWVGLHTAEGAKLIKVGARGERVRRLQRALNAALERPPGRERDPRPRRRRRR